MEDLRDLAPRLRLWAQTHTARAWICAILLVVLVVLLVSLITGWG